MSIRFVAVLFGILSVCAFAASIHGLCDTHDDHDATCTLPSTWREGDDDISAKCLVDSTPSHNNDNNDNNVIRLPSFDQGGIIFFVHIPKTGGTTIRRNLETMDRIDYVFARNYSVHTMEVSKVEHAIVHGTTNNTILFYEIHAKNTPSFYRLRQRLQRWRNTATEHQVPIFFFTLIRDPLSFSFSHFTFFHVQERNPTFERCEASEENFLRLSLWNPQCQFLHQGEPSWRSQHGKKKNTVRIQPDECLEVQDSLWKLLDWVGTTERLTNETLPILSHLLNIPRTFVFQRFKVSKDSGETFGLDNVTSTTVDTILKRSSLDTMLYEHVQRRYNFSRIILT